MGRPVVGGCCDKVGVKKGPWTPEEDIILVSYIHDHGPGNWRSVPANTGLSRCSKSCRLRWTNYLRPGIKRGNFSEHEEKMIVHLQALLGNRWAAIASYLPHRTDNDVKNYWNTHLRKKLGKQQQQLQGHVCLDGNKLLLHTKPVPVSKGQWERRLQTDIQTAKQALSDALSLDKSDSAVVVDHQRPSPITAKLSPIQTSTYAVNADNIARLLENWNSNNESPKKPPVQTNPQSPTDVSNLDIISKENSLGGFEDERKGNLGMPLSLLEKWLLDESGAQGQDGDFMGLGDIEGGDAGLL